MKISGLTKRKIIILMLFLIPAGWAVLVQILVRRSPPGAAITDVSGDIIWAMKQIPEVDPESPVFELRYDLDVGDTWACVIEATPTKSGEDIIEVVSGGQENEAGLPEVRSGTYEIRVDEKVEGRWLVSITSAEGGALAAPFRFWLDEFGNMGPYADKDIGSDVRDVLYRATGIYLAGPFTPELRARDWCSKSPGSCLGLPTAKTIERLHLQSSPEVMQPSGGLKFMGPLSYVDNVYQFKILSYRRMQFEQNQWEGYVELVTRADYTCPKGKIHLLNGEARFRDLIALQKARKVGSTKEHALFVKQTMTATGE